MYNVDNYCRACLRTEINLTPLSTPDSDNIPILDKLTTSVSDVVNKHSIHWYLIEK